MPNTNTTRTAFTSTRNFGVEIELTGLTTERAAAVLRAGGITATAEPTNHTTRSYWKVVRDGSVSNGCEVVSPILSGVDGLAQVRKVAALLAAAGATADRSCGLHVHVDGAGLSGKEIIHVAKRYAAHEAQIDRVMPASRRASRNSYCMGMDGLVSLLDTYDAQPTVDARSLCQRFGRYYKVNLSAFVVHGTLEFRQHSGTVNGDKIANWIMFCVTFVEDSRLAPVAPVAVAPVGRPVRRNAVSTKLDKLQTMLSRAGMYTVISAGSIAQELDIAEASVPSYISMFRMANPTLTVQARRGSGYYTQMNMPLPGAVVAMTAPAMAAPAPRRSTVGPFDSLPAEVRSFFAEREVEFSA